MPSNRNKLRSIGGVGNISKYTSPLKLFDYLASGKLIISSKLKVFEEIIKNNENCIMIKKLDTMLWFKTIKRLKNRVDEINKIKKKTHSYCQKSLLIKKEPKKMLMGLKLK